MDVNWKRTEMAWHFSEIIVECKEKVEAMPSRWRLRTHEFHIETIIQFKIFLNLKQNKLSFLYLVSLLSITVFVVDIEVGIVMVLVLVLKTVRAWQPGKNQNMQYNGTVQYIFYWKHVQLISKQTYYVLTVLLTSIRNGC